MKAILRMRSVDNEVRCIRIDAIRSIDYLTETETGIDWLEEEGDGVLACMDAFPIRFLDLLTVIANLTDEVRSLRRRR